MSIEELMNDKGIKPKEKTEMVSSWLLEGKLSTEQLIEFAGKGKDPVRATCIEAMEFATKQKPALADEPMLTFVTQSLGAMAPRIKWEAAKVIGNIAHLFPAKLDEAVSGLLVNTEHEGTVVRWSAAYALGEIVKLKTKRNKDLIPAVEAICQREEKNSIRKIYVAALKAAAK